MASTRSACSSIVFLVGLICILLLIAIMTDHREGVPQKDSEVEPTGPQPTQYFSSSFPLSASSAAPIQISTREVKFVLESNSKNTVPASTPTTSPPTQAYIPPCDRLKIIHPVIHVLRHNGKNLTDFSFPSRSQDGSLDPSWFDRSFPACSIAGTQQSGPGCRDGKNIWLTDVLFSLGHCREILYAPAVVVKNRNGELRFVDRTAHTFTRGAAGCGSHILHQLQRLEKGKEEASTSSLTSHGSGKTTIVPVSHLSSKLTKIQFAEYGNDNNKIRIFEAATSPPSSLLYWPITMYASMPTHNMESLMGAAYFYEKEGLTIPWIIPSIVRASPPENGGNQNRIAYHLSTTWFSVAELFLTTLQIPFVTVDMYRFYRADQVVFPYLFDAADGISYHRRAVMACVFAWWKNKFVPRVLKTFHHTTLQELSKKNTKISWVKVQGDKFVGSGYRAFSRSSKFEQLLVDHEFAVLNSSQPFHSKLKNVNEASVAITSWGAPFYLLDYLRQRDDEYKLPKRKNEEANNSTESGGEKNKKNRTSSSFSVVVLFCHIVLVAKSQPTYFSEFQSALLPEKKYGSKIADWPRYLRLTPADEMGHPNGRRYIFLLVNHLDNVTADDLRQCEQRGEIL